MEKKLKTYIKKVKDELGEYPSVKEKNKDSIIYNVYLSLDSLAKLFINTYLNSEMGTLYNKIIDNVELPTVHKVSLGFLNPDMSKFWLSLGVKSSLAYTKEKDGTLTQSGISVDMIERILVDENVDTSISVSTIRNATLLVNECNNRNKFTSHPVDVAKKAIKELGLTTIGLNNEQILEIVPFCLADEAIKKASSQANSTATTITKVVM